MIMNYESRTEMLYQLINSLPRMNHTIAKKQLPLNGIYLFFEKGEQITINSQKYDRIVRVGTHNKYGNFPGRIRQHYGNVNSLKGNKNGSVFRKHLGGALMRRNNVEDARLPGWLKQMGPSYAEIEEEVSLELRGNFTFACFPVNTKEDRLSIETGLLSLLAQYPIGEPSDFWLGRSADSPIIRKTGLWNTKDVDKTPLSEEQYNKIENFCKLQGRISYE